LDLGYNSKPERANFIGADQPEKAFTSAELDDQYLVFSKPFRNSPICASAEIHSAISRRFWDFANLRCLNLSANPAVANFRRYRL